MSLAEMDGNSQNNATEDERLKQYKNVAKHEDMRRRRTECSVELRKQKRDDMMMKRRNVIEDESEDEQCESDKPQGPSTASKGAVMSNEEILRILTNSPSLDDMRTCFEQIRRTLSKSKNPPIDDIIKCDLHKALVAALGVEDDKIRMEAAWGLTNIVSGSSEQTFAAVQAGATAPLVALMMSTNISLAEQCLWAVANIAGDSAQLRDVVIQNNGVAALMHLITLIDQATESFARTLAWAFSNMCRHKNPHAPLHVLRELSKGLRVLVQSEDKDTRQDACWAVSYLTDGPDDQIQLAVDAGILPFIKDMLQEGDALTAPALRVLGNMATGNDALTQVVVDIGTLEQLHPLAERAKSSTIIKECCWLISNVIAGTQSQIQAVIEANLLPLIIEVLNSGDFKCQFEASWAVANLAQGGNSQQVLHLWHDGVIPPLCNLMKSKNADVLSNVLDTLRSILVTVSTVQPERLDQLREQIEENDGVERLEQLQVSESEKIYKMAYNLINEFFNDDEDADDVVTDENTQPTYSF